MPGSPSPHEHVSTNRRTVGGPKTPRRGTLGNLGGPKVTQLVTIRVCIRSPNFRVRALPPSTCMTPLGDLMSPEWVVSAEEQEGLPSGGLRPTVGVSLCDAEAPSPFPAAVGSFSLPTDFLPSSTSPSWAAGCAASTWQSAQEQGFEMGSPSACGPVWPLRPHRA